MLPASCCAYHVPIPVLSPCCQLHLLSDLVPPRLNSFLPCWVVSAACWAVPVLGMAPMPLPGLCVPQFPHHSSQCASVPVLGCGCSWCDGGGWCLSYGPSLLPVSLSWGTRLAGDCGSWAVPWLWHWKTLQFGSATLSSLVPFPSLLCPRPRHVHCCRMVLGLVAMSLPIRRALPAGTSLGSGRALPGDTGATCALRGKTLDRHRSLHYRGGLELPRQMSVPLEPG